MSVQKAIECVEEAEVWLRDALEEIPVTTGKRCSHCGEARYTNREKALHRTRLSLEGQMQKIRRVIDNLKEA